MNAEQQREASLKKANRVRHAKSVAKKKLRSRKVSLVDALNGKNAAAKHLTLRELLLASPGIGQDKMRRVVRRSKAPRDGIVGQLHDGARARVIDAVREECPSVWARLQEEKHG